MISRYADPQMTVHFKEDEKYRRWLVVETVAAKRMGELGVIPKDAADAIYALPWPLAEDIAAYKAREAVTRHDVAAFVDVIGKSTSLGEHARWFHYGLTSSDVVDTALGLMLKGAGRVLIGQLDRLKVHIAMFAHEHKDTMCLARTHGMPAEPTTMGYRAMGWYHQMDRVIDKLQRAIISCEVGKLSGAVGTYSIVPREVEWLTLKELGLRPDLSATQIVQRDRHATLLNSMAVVGAVIERITTELRLLQRDGQVFEGFGIDQKGSSAMPHKKNPITGERMCGLSRLLRGYAVTAMENVALWDERDISHSSVERVVFEDAFCVLDHMARSTTTLVEDLVVDKEALLRAVIDTGGSVLSQQALHHLIREGMTRDEAYRYVQGGTAGAYRGVSYDGCLKNIGWAFEDDTDALREPPVALGSSDGH